MARDRDDFDDVTDRPAPTGGGGPLDSFFLNTPLWVIASIAFFFCCFPAGVVLGLIGMLTARSPAAKKNATIMLVIAGAAFLLNVILYGTGLVALPMMGAPVAPVPVPAPQ